MLQAIAAAAAAMSDAAATVVSAPTASADEYDYLDFLDCKGDLYTSSLDVPKARQQQAAARARWDSGSHRRVSA